MHIAGLEVLSVLLCVGAVYSVVRLLIVRTTGCQCTLDLDKVIEEDDVLVCVYRGSRGNVSLEFIRRVFSGTIPQSVDVVADRIGVIYTDKDYALLVIRTVVFITSMVIVLMLRISTVIY